MLSCFIGTVALACLLVQPSVSDRIVVNDAERLDGEESGDVCRCQVATMKCVKNGGIGHFFSSEWADVQDLGFCDATLAQVRIALEQAIGSITSWDWDGDLTGHLTDIQSNISAFKGEMDSKISTVSESEVAGLSADNLVESENRGKAVYLHYLDLLKMATGITQKIKLDLDKRKEVLLSAELQRATQGISISDLEKAMKAANEACFGKPQGTCHVEVPWSLIRLAQARQSMLIARKEKLERSNAKVERSRDFLINVMARVQEVKTEMEALESIQQDLGEDVIAELYQNKEVTKNDDEVLRRLKVVENDLQIEDSKSKLEELKSSTDATIARMGR